MDAFATGRPHRIYLEEVCIHIALVVFSASRDTYFVPSEISKYPISKIRSIVLKATLYRMND